MANVIILSLKRYMPDLAAVNIGEEIIYNVN